jgi:hypothetical protein
MAGNTSINVGFGVSGQVLTSNGNGVLPTFKTNATSGSLVFLDSQNGTNVSGVEFTTGISSTYDNYLLLTKADIPAAASWVNSLIIQISDDGGATYKTSNYVTPSNGSVLVSSGLRIDTSMDSSINRVSIYSLLANFTAANNYAKCTTLSSGKTDSGVLTSQNSGGMYTVSPFSVNAFRLVMTNGATFSVNATLYGYSAA